MYNHDYMPQQEEQSVQQPQPSASPQPSAVSQQVVTSVPSPSSEVPVTTVVTSMGTRVKAAIGAAIGVSVLGAGIAAFFFFRTPAHVPADPQKLLFMAFEQLMTAQDVRMRLSVSGATLEALDERGNLDAADAAGVDAAAANMTVTVDVARVGEKTASNVLLEVVEGEEQVGIEFRGVNGDLFVRIVRVVSSQLPEDARAYIDRWVRINVFEIEQQVRSLFEEGDGEESFDPSQYVHFDVGDYLPRMRDLYLAKTPFNLSLMQEDTASGRATVRIELNENAVSFIRDWTIETYTLYLAEVDRVIAERESIGDAAVVSGLRAYRARLVDVSGERGEKLAAQFDDFSLDDAWGDLDKVATDVVILLDMDTKIGRVLGIRWIFAFKDGVQRDPVALRFEEYNSGRTIAPPEKFEDLMDLVESFFGASFAEGTDEVSDAVEDTVDSDADGLTDARELALNTDPNKVDTDGDGLSDGVEMDTYITMPTQADSDEDSLTDGDEVNIYKTSPIDPDTDGDGYHDGVEVKGGYDPLK